MSKTKQPELILQAEIIGSEETSESKASGLRGQGFYCEKQSERFKAGRPDLRIARRDLGQLDVELKVCNGSPFEMGTQFGFTKLQWLHLKKMNEHGIPAIGLVFFPANNFYLVTVDMVLGEALSSPPWTCFKLPMPQIIEGRDVFEAAKGLLSERGYQHLWRF